MFSPTRFVLLAGLFGLLTAVPANGTEEFANPPRPFPVVMGEQIAANLVDLIFLFDRVASDPPTATTSHYLEWVSQPSSPFYNDYLEYRQGRIGRAELVRDLAHGCLEHPEVQRLIHPASTHRRLGCGILQHLPSEVFASGHHGALGMTGKIASTRSRSVTSFQIS